ncbi:MAG: LPS export ABC transporter periplasmic protein LptC [Gemmatimonadaceae bacterium]|nr:LPS export ABC transporter periplasmic protein LptC [Chitinophagaceae bacterium]
MSFPQNIFFVKIITALFLGCFALSSCENDEEEIKKLNQDRIALEEGRFIESYLSQGAKVKAKLTAPLMYRYVKDSSYVEFPKTLHVDFFNDTLAKESQLDARYGKYREFERKVFLRDSVVVMNILKGDTLYADELWWNQDTQMFYTDKPVRIHKKDQSILRGKKGMESKQDLSDMVFFGTEGRGIVPKDSTAGF